MSGGARRRILFVTSNGTGLGHLTRSMAIARRLDPDLEPLFVTFSAAAPVVAGLGFPVEYLASYDRPGAGDDLSWTLRNRARLRRMVDEIEPAAVLFDGTHPYERLLASLRFADAPLVWSRRAMWRRDADTSALWRSHLFDAVLEPGDFAESADRGPTVSRRREAHRVGPMVLLDRSELLSREQAESELGLEPGRTNVLVSLGQGASIREASRRCLEHLAGRGDVQVAAVSSTLAGAGEVPPGVVALAATYPISRYLDAFDVAVSAAGYNGFSELVRLGPPALFVAMDRRTDDQAARASWVEQAGAGRAVESPSDPELERKLDELLDPELRAAMRSRLDGIEAPDGAAEAADWLGRLARPQGEAARLAETDLPGDSGLGSVPGTGAQAPGPGLPGAPRA
ncbi:MAG: hypothetical protein H0W09_04670, partial [Solirubrobacterales bacterium]|nr:hypothetical protein [Solirubrobacterales bacterium]